MKLQKKLSKILNQKSIFNLRIKSNIIVAFAILILLGIFTFYLYKNQIRPYHLEKTVLNSKRYQTKVKLLFAKSLKKGSVILFGDSILESLSFENDKIYNYSIGGETIGLLKKRILKREYPDSCSFIIMIGLNDFLFNMPAKKIIEDYKSLINLITSKIFYPKIILLELLPISANGIFVDKEAVNILIQEFNTELRSLAKKDVSGKIYFIPLYDQFKDHNAQLNTIYNYDGVHLNAKGAKLLKENILNFLSNERIK